MSTTSQRSRWATLAPAALLLWPALATAVLEIPDSPLFLTSAGVTPNMVITLDDSGSMAWGRIPDGLNTTNRNAKSPFNPIYYNPATIYRIPPDINGNPVAAPTFGAAFINGFHQARGTVNLATAYRPTNEFNPSSATQNFMTHFAVATVVDPVRPNATWATRFDRGPMVGTNAGANAPYFTVPGFVDADGSRSGHNPGTNIVAVTVEGQGAAAVYDGTFTLPCTNANDPGAANRYRTNITGGTLTLCFNDTGSMYGKMVSVIHRSGPGPGYVPPAANTDNAAAYYYVFDAANYVNATGGGLCVPTTAAHQTDNDCYTLRMVGQQPGPDDLDNDGDVDGDDERQNFANWYSFYRIRNLMTLSAAAFAFRTVPETSRIAWQAINSCRSNASTLVTSTCRGWDNTVPVVNNAIKPLTGAHRTNFYNWLFRLPASGSTPLLNAMERVGRYYQTSGSGSPYDDDLTDTTNNRESTCRRNFHILMTDGIWNSNVAFQTTYGNADSTARTLPDGIGYNPSPPFSDTNAPTNLADMAFYYWANDLRTNLTDAVPSYVTDFSGEANTRYFNPKNNPASWQHLVNFNVGLGLSGFLRGPSPALTWGGNTYAGSYAGLVAGTLTWPATQDDAIPGNIADLWHAAINSRGKFYSAEKPDDLIAAFQDIMNSITTQAASGGGAGLSSNTSQIDQEGALIFEAKFNADWSGQLLARTVNDKFQLQEPLWDAGLRILAPYERNIFTFNGESEAIRLEADCPGGPLEEALDRNAVGDSDGLCTQRTNWFRGDGKVEGASAAWRDDDPLSGFAVLTFEVTDHGYLADDKLTVDGVTVSAIPDTGVDFNGTFTVTAITDNAFSVEVAATELPGTYTGGGRVHYTDLRNRPISVLGDIMNSDPVYSDGGDFGYGGAEVRPSEVAYAAFVEAKAGIPPIIYAGANDGMLHAFCAENPNDPESSCPAGIEPGEELFAYIPQAVYENLSALTDPLYAHRYYVDGQISVADAYLGGAWGTYLVGALGAGGKGIFALDVSDPVGFAAADVKWEFTDADNLGLTFSKPQIARTAIDAWGERWGVIFGNGYNSANDRAHLFVVDLADGSPIAEIAAGNETANGLSTPYLHDSNGDAVVDAVYVGDLRGNLWKFVNTGGVWTLGNGGQPLFTARNAQNEVQPITVQPVISAHPDGGILVYFGTGSYLTACDIGNPVDCTGTYDDQQAFYAIWDNGEAGTVARADLAGYSIVTETTAFGHQVRTTSTGSLDWAIHRGWYLDLPRTPNSPAERIVSPAIVLEFTAASVPDRILFVTNTPSSDPCTMGGTSWLMELDLLTGGRLAGPVFDLDKSGTFDSHDTVGGVPPSGVAIDSSYGLTGEPLILTTEGGNIVKAFAGTTGKSGTDATPLQQGEPPPSEGAPTRVYWRQIQ